MHASIVEQNYHGAILVIKSGGVSSQAFVRLYHLFCRIVVDPQQKRYRFLITPQPADAMLHRMHLGRVAASGGGPMRLLGMLYAPKRVPMVEAHR